MFDGRSVAPGGGGGGYLPTTSKAAPKHIKWAALLHGMEWKAITMSEVGNGYNVAFLDGFKCGIEGVVHAKRMTATSGCW